MSVTLRELVDRTLLDIGEVSGAGAQAYSDDKLFRQAIRAFNLLFLKREWEQYCTWVTVTLDGVLGIPSTDAFDPASVYVKDFTDFLRVSRSGERSALPILSGNLNPSTILGNKVTHWTSLRPGTTYYNKRRLQFYPILAVGDVNIRARVYPVSTWAWT